MKDYSIYPVECEEGNNWSKHHWSMFRDDIKRNDFRLHNSFCNCGKKQFYVAEGEFYRVYYDTGFHCMTIEKLPFSEKQADKAARDLALFLARYIFERHIGSSLAVLNDELDKMKFNGLTVQVKLSPKDSGVTIIYSKEEE